MKILAVVDRKWPCDHAFLEEVLARRLPQRGHAVRFVMPADGPANGGEHDWHGASVRAVPGGSRALREALRREHSAARPDVVYVRNLALPAAWACRHVEAPLVFQLSHFKEETLLLRNRSERFRPARELKARLHRRLRRRVMRCADLVLPISDAMREVLARSGERSGAMCVMPLGADPPAAVEADEVRRLREQAGVGQDGALILYLGTLNVLRGLELLVDAFARLRAARPGSVLVILGRGPEASDREQLEAAVARAGIADAVEFLGWLPRRRVGAWLMAADIGLSYFPDHWIFRTNSPTKVMEYLAAGLPVVCSDQPEQRAVVEGCAGGEVVQRDDADEYASAMLRVLQGGADRAVIARRFAELRSYDLLADRLEKALRELT